MKNKFILIGTIALLISITSYCFLIPVTNLFISEFFPYQITDFLLKLNKIIPLSFYHSNFFILLRFYLIDFLWFLSFCCFMKITFFHEKKIQLTIFLSMAFISEFSQLFFPRLGTFDIADLIIYITISFIIFPI